MNLPYKNRVDFMSECPEYLDNELKLCFVRKGIFYFKGYITRLTDDFLANLNSQDEYAITVGVGFTDMQKMNMNLIETVENLLGCEHIQLYIDGVQYLNS